MAASSLGLASSALAQVAPPTSLHAVASGATQIALGWTRSTSTASTLSYEVVRESSEGNHTASTDRFTANYLDTGLVKGREYKYKVRAVVGSEKSTAAELSTSTASSVTERSECSPTSLPSGHYTLASNLLVKKSGTPCLKFEASNVSLECNGHKIEDEQGSENWELALELVGAKHFLITGCEFLEPDPAPERCCLVKLLGSEEGVVSDDRFASAQGADFVENYNSKNVVFDSNVFLNAPMQQHHGESDYFGHNVATQPGQNNNDAFSLGETGVKNTLDANRLDGNSHFAHAEHEYAGPGGDDVLGMQAGETEDTVVGNSLLAAWDCGAELGQLVEHERFESNLFDEDWAAGMCSYWQTSWKENTIAANTSAYGGALFTVNANNEVAYVKKPKSGTQEEYETIAQAENYFLGNLFEGNAELQGKWDYSGWDNSALIQYWNESEQEFKVKLHVGSNRFLKNNFGGTLPAPFIRKTSPTALISSQSGNKCGEPPKETLASETLTCGTPTTPEAPAPRVIGLYPAQGPVSGGTQAQIEGSGLEGATEVKFVGAHSEHAATIVSRLGDDRLVVSTPAGEAAEAVNVRVVTPRGTSELPSSSWPLATTDQFTYGNVPVVSSLTPAQGSLHGWTSVTIAGSGLAEASEVRFGAASERSCSISASPCFTVESSNSIQAVSAPESGGHSHVHVTVVTPAGTSTVIEGIAREPSSPVNDEFGYVPPPTSAPIVTAVEPGNTLEPGGNTVTITGEHFESVESVRFGSINAASFIVTSPTSITAQAPTGFGQNNVTVTSPAGRSEARSSDLFTYFIGGPAGGPYQHLGVKGNIPASGPWVLTMPNEGSGFSIGPLEVTAEHSKAKVEIDAQEPAFVETAPNEYESTGHGIEAELEGRNSTEHLIGPLLFSCTVPSSVLLAEIPYSISPNPPMREYTASYQATCVMAAGSLNEKREAAVTMSVSGPEWMAPGESVTLTAAKFKLTVPEQWRENLIALGATNVVGYATSSAWAEETG